MPKMQDKVMTVPNYVIPHIRFKGESGTKAIDRKMVQDITRENAIYPDPFYWPPPKPVKTPIPKIPQSLSAIDPELNTNFEDNSPFQEGVISEMYQRPDKSYFQEPQELEGLINTGRFIQKFLLKETNIKTLKIIQRKLLKEHIYLLLYKYRQDI